MQELINQKVRIILNDSHGFVTLVGKFLRIEDSFILLDTTLGPIYVSVTSIKTIQPTGELHEAK